MNRISITYLAKIFLSVLVVTTMVTTTVLGEELEGTLFLGDGLNIKLAEQESFFQELLRYFNLKKSPRNLINLSELGAKGDNIFIGEDMKLYFTSESNNGAAYCIGKARKLWELELDKDVDLAQVKTVGDLFSSKDKGNLKLRIKTGSSRKRAREVKQATFRFWLEELVFEYDSYSPDNSTDENYPYICNAIKSALPLSENDSDNRLSKIEYLKEYINEVSGMDLIPLRSLIEEVMNDALSRKASVKLIKDYEEILSGIIKKTEGL